MDHKKFEEITGRKSHHQFSRNLLQFDRYINDILKCYENNERFYLVALFTPTKASLNLNDINNLLVLKWLQEFFNVPAIIHVCDNHRFLKPLKIEDFMDEDMVKEVFETNFPTLYKEMLDSKDKKKKVTDVVKITMKEYTKAICIQQGIKEEFKIPFHDKLVMKNIAEIIAIGFNPINTFVCRNMKYIGQCASYYENIVKLGSQISFGQSISSYNTNCSDDIETISLVSKDMSAIFASSYPDIFQGQSNIRAIVMNLSENKMHISRKLAYNMQWPKPASVCVESLPALHGNGKMDSYGVNSAIFFNDSDKEVKRKINKFAFSGGRETQEEHEKYGGNCDVDVSYQYLRYFIEDDLQLEDIKQKYQAGRLRTGTLKSDTAEIISKLLTKIQTNLKNLTDENIRMFMTPRSLDFGSMCIQPAFMPEEPEEEIKEGQVEELEIVEKPDESGDLVTPWEVIGNAETGIDYDKLIEQYGSSKIEQSLVDKFEEVTGKKAHHLLRRGMFYSHRDFNEILEAYRKGEKFFLYTGRGPSSDALHMGHMIPFLFTKWLQDIFNVPLVIQLTDDEKCIMRNISTDDVKHMAIENVKDIIAVGFDPKKTFIFRDLEYIAQEPAFFETALRIGSKINFNTVKAIFGFEVSDCVEKIAFPPKQAAPCFASAFPAIFGTNCRSKCLIPCAIDQDPYFRMTRDVAPRLNTPKPALIHSRFFPSLQGNQTKMSASDLNSAIFMTDTVSEIANKINNHTYTISKDQKQSLSIDQICERDICYQYLTFFIEDQDKLESIKAGLQSNSIDEVEMKAELISILTPLVQAHQARREAITDEMIIEFMTPRSLEW